jgi:hypothetical protein
VKGARDLKSSSEERRRRTVARKTVHLLLRSLV